MRLFDSSSVIKKGEGRREKGEGKREKGEGRREKGEGSRGAGENNLSFSPITDYQLPITHYPLPITHYRLPITHYPLPITKMEQQSSMQFLTLEESAEVDKALLASHEKFLTRLTISSLKLLQYIAKDTGVAMEDLTTQQVIAWFEKDGKIRREQGIEAAFLKW